MFDKIFIIYAGEDYAMAEQLYQFLGNNNYKPWIDKRCILPGQDWNFTIKKALRDATYIIILLSSSSVEKRGYIQREFRLALDYCVEKLDDDIYLIPLKLDDCKIPNDFLNINGFPMKAIKVFS